jgi:hypothetical protein
MRDGGIVNEEDAFRWELRQPALWLSVVAANARNDSGETGAFGKICAARCGRKRIPQCVA